MALQRTFRAALLVLALLAVSSIGFSQTIPKRAIPQPSDERIKFIRQEQKAHVRESYGEGASQCFTDDNLTAFHKADTTGAIVRRLRTDQRFLGIVAKIKVLSADRQREVLETAKKTFKPSWAELGRVDRAGQTDAGQAAEREIAEAIAAEVGRMLQGGK